MSFQLRCSNWFNVDSDAFRKTVVYERLKWSNTVDIQNSLCAAAQFGGPIAVATPLQGGLVGRNGTITIHSSSGGTTCKIQWSKGDLLKMFWTSRQDLLCVQKDGKVYVYTYSITGAEKPNLQFSMGSEAQEYKVAEVKSFESFGGTGLAVVIGSNRVFVVNNVYEPKLWRAAEIPKRPERPTCWTVLSKGRTTRIVLVMGKDLFVLTQGQLPEQVFPAVTSVVRQYVRISISEDLDKIALLSDNGLMQIVRSDFKECLCEVACQFREDFPFDLRWCGSDAVLALESNRILLMVGLGGATLRFEFDEVVYVETECDGARIFSATQLEFLSRVPEAVTAVYQVASTEPSAILLDASAKFHKGSHHAYDYLRMVEDRLDLAITQCIEAAGHEWTPDSQRELLQAACFGKTFSRTIDPDSFVHMCRILRVLNAIRHRNFGIPITYAQLEKLTITVLIDRLIATGLWPLLMSICEHLRLKPEDGTNRVLAHWACQKIDDAASVRGRTGVAGDHVKLAEVIHAKFAQYPGVPYADVAVKASQCQMNDLASLLLENEPQISKQVRMLLKLKRPQKALARATESGDPDLVNSVIFELKGSMDRAELDLLLRKFPTAYALYRCSAKAEESAEHLKALHRQQDDFCAQALCWLKDAANAQVFSVGEKQTALSKAEACLVTVKETVFGQQLADHVRLLRYQTEMEQRFGQPFADLALKDTLVWLIQSGEHSRADAYRKEFKVSDKLFHWWKIEGLIKGDRLQELETFSKSKRPPLGYLPFVELCAKYGKVDEAEKYVKRLSAVDDIVSAKILLNDLDGAAKVAIASNNSSALLDRINSHCAPNQRAVKELIASAKSQSSVRSK